MDIQLRLLEVAPESCMVPVSRQQTNSFKDLFELWNREPEAIMTLKDKETIARRALSGVWASTT